MNNSTNSDFNKIRQMNEVYLFPRDQKNNFNVKRMRFRKLLGDQSMDLLIVEEARTTDQIPNNINEALFHPEYREYFSETFGITGVRPVFIDHSGMVILTLDDHGIMFKWNEMDKYMEEI
ncbi:8598_t:CDS:2 [Scutellospora calospora]|uniref:8598_t:CDS:1 n=1 Tax=Scutellospora calospora TaxID=85575 RepID=A0ACA9JU54_9GLOM|nr:8598_t:CDS:2 [Scutellospora calospora]